MKTDVDVNTDERAVRTVPRASTPTATRPSSTPTLPRTATPPAPVQAPAEAPAEREGRRSGRSLRDRLKRPAIVLGAVAAIVLGVLLATVPYERGLVGYVEGDRRTVATECGVPLAAAFASGSEVLNSDGTWAGNPPCQRSAGFRLGVAGLLAGGGLLALFAAKPGRRQEAQV